MYILTGMDIRQAVDFLASELGFEEDNTILTSTKGTVQYTRLAPPAKFFGDIGVHPGGTQVRSVRFINSEKLELYTKQGLVQLDLKRLGSIGHLRDFFETGRVTLADYDI